MSTQPKPRTRHMRAVTLPPEQELPLAPIPDRPSADHLDELARYAATQARGTRGRPHEL